MYALHAISNCSLRSVFLSSCTVLVYLEVFKDCQLHPKQDLTRDGSSAERVQWRMESIGDVLLKVRTARNPLGYTWYRQVKSSLSFYNRNDL